MQYTALLTLILVATMNLVTPSKHDNIASVSKSYHELDKRTNKQTDEKSDKKDDNKEEDTKSYSSDKKVDIDSLIEQLTDIFFTFISM